MKIKVAAFVLFLVGCGVSAEDAAAAAAGLREAADARQRAANAAAAAAEIARDDAESARLEAHRQAENAAAEAAAVVWSYREDTDPMTSRVSRFASIGSVNTIDLESPYEGSQRAKLLVRNHPSNGKDVMLMIQRGQLLCPSYQDCDITVRFDEGQPESWRASGAADGSSTVIFLRRYDDFVRKLRSASIVRIRADIYQAGSPVFEFTVAGYDDSRVNPAGTPSRRGSPADALRGFLRDSHAAAPEADPVVKPPCASSPAGCPPSPAN